MFNNFDLIKQELIKYPLYKQRGKQEVFLGIKNTSTNKWVGFKIIKELKRKKEFPYNQEKLSEIYDLALFYWCLYFDELLKSNNINFSSEYFNNILTQVYNF